MSKNNLMFLAVAIVIIFAAVFINVSLRKPKKQEVVPEYSTEQWRKDSTERAHNDSIGKAKADQFLKQLTTDNEKWYKTKAGKINKKHPEWTKEECENIAAGKIWIGMHYKMLVYMWGKPDVANPSNYGRGTQWQWCWHDYNPSCFYGGDDGIVTAYN